jgi:ribose 5-phosphate isomerase B
MQANRDDARPADGLIAVGTDHAGVELKNRLLAHMRDRGLDVRDYGAYEIDPGDDYPDIAFAIGRAVSTGEAGSGILVCGTGIGMSIAANKVPEVRAALCITAEAAHFARSHNDANILVLAGRDVRAEDPMAVVDTFTDTAFTGEDRHRRRLRKIHQVERDGWADALKGVDGNA